MGTKTCIGEFVAPEIDVIETKSRDILCSSGDTEQFVDGISYGNDDFIGGSDYE